MVFILSLAFLPIFLVIVFQIVLFVFALFIILLNFWSMANSFPFSASSQSSRSFKVRDCESGEIVGIECKTSIIHELSNSGTATENGFRGCDRVYSLSSTFPKCNDWERCRVNKVDREVSSAGDVPKSFESSLNDGLAHHRHRLSIVFARHSTYQKECLNQRY
jgi:hypothetical protein